MNLIKALIVFIVLSMPSMVMANEWRDLNTKVEEHNLDGPMHFIIGGGSAYVVQEYTNIEKGWKRTLASIAIPVAIGTVKELTDRKFNGDDILGYGLGAICVNLFYVKF